MSRSDDQLFRALQDALAGQPIRDGIAALTSSLAATIAFASADRAHAEQLIEQVAKDVAREVGVFWPGMREARAAADAREKA
jgi:hypothetical protein